MEYAEEEEEEQPAEQILLEATAAIPNIPVPRSSDENVRHTFLSLYSLIPISSSTG